MEISLLLSAAQFGPSSEPPCSDQQNCLSSSPVSVQNEAPFPNSRLIQHSYPNPRPSLPPNNPIISPLAPPPHPRFRYSLPPVQGKIEKKTNKPFRCTFEGCEATFGQKGSLTRHVKSRHEKLRPHSCDLCQKSFSALWTLRVHQRNVHLKSKPHKCHLCEKSFGELFNKSKHIAIVHEGKRPFSCPICSRAFGYKGDMRKHVLELHEQSGRPFQCMVPSCGVKFARKRYLRRHENLSHKGTGGHSSRDLPSSPETSANVSYRSGVSAVTTPQATSLYASRASGQGVGPSKLQSFPNSMMKGGLPTDIGHQVRVNGGVHKLQ